MIQLYIPIPENNNVIPISINIQRRARGFGQFGCFGFAEGDLIAQIISLTVSLNTFPQSVFFDIISTPEIVCYYTICISIKIQ